MHIKNQQQVTYIYTDVHLLENQYFKINDSKSMQNMFEQRV